jgi:hypothetical protein
MGIVVALDVHRNQITYKLLDRDTGEVRRGRVAPAARVDVRAWLAQFAGHEVEFALEGQIHDPGGQARLRGQARESRRTPAASSSTRT